MLIKGNKVFNGYLSRQRPYVNMDHRISIQSILCVTILCLLVTQSQCANTTETSVSVKPPSVTLTSFESLDKGMKPLYQMVEVFLGKVIQAKMINGSQIDIAAIAKSPMDVFNIVSWKELVVFYIGFVVCAAIGILFIVVMPFVALIFCCCRCSGKCGGKAREMDPQSSKCKRSCYFIFIMLLATLVLAGVVCAFVTVSLAYQRFSATDDKNPFNQVNKAYDMYVDFMDHTQAELNDGTIGKFDKFIVELIDRTNNSATKAIDDTMDSVNATEVFDTAERFGEDVGVSIALLESLQDQLGNLTVLSAKLEVQLTSLKTNSLETLETCKNLKNLAGIKKSCEDEHARVTNLEVNVNFTALDKLDGLKENINKVKGVREEIAKGRQEFEKIKQNSTITDSIKDAINKIEEVSTSTKTSLNDGLRRVNQTLSMLRVKSLKGFIKTVDDIMKKYSIYWYYPLMALSGVMGLVVALSYFGLLFGMCGHRPTTGHDPCCNRGAAANILMSGVAFFLIFCMFFMLIVVIFFLPGGLVYTEVCRYTNDHNPQSLKAYDKVANLKTFGINISRTLPEILQDCKDNKGFYKSFGAYAIVNISDIINLSTVEEEIDKVNVDTDSVKVNLPAKMKEDLKNFGKSGFKKVNISSYRRELEKNLTSGDLGKIALNLDNLSIQLNVTSQNDLAVKFTAIATDMRKIDNTTIRQMKLIKDNLSNTVNGLAKRINYEEKVNNLLKKINDSEYRFNTEGKQKVKEFVETTKMNLKKDINTFADKTIKFIEDDAGRCQPFYDAVYHSTDAVCVSVLNPLNGFWFSIGWCLFFCIPLIILAVKLAGLYRIHYPYSEGGQYDDRTMAMYQYEDGQTDTIPLTSLDKGPPRAHPGMPNTGYSHEDQRGGVYPGGHLRSGSYPRYSYPNDNHHPGERINEYAKPRSMSYPNQSPQHAPPSYYPY